MNTDLTLTSSPNFCDEAGNAYLVRCPECKKENYSMTVAIGICTWCNFNLNEFIENKKEKKEHENITRDKQNN